MSRLLHTMPPATDTAGMGFEVFLSFRGPDTRRDFTSCLHRELVDKGIRVFKDDKELRAGQKIEGELLHALNDSHLYIPIFSKGFASSPWCLHEVAHMVYYTSKSEGKKQILPVFLDVETDDVKLRTELYRNALSKHVELYGPDEVKRWENALIEVPTTVGWKLEGKDYGELIKLIVREVQLKLMGKNRSLPNNLVQMDDEEDIEKLLDVDSDDNVLFIVIHGTGGIGKSTLASITYNHFRSQFDCSSFLEDVQDLSQRDGLLDVQKKLLCDTLGSTSAQEIYDTNEGVDRIKRGLNQKRVLVVLDNVDEKKQLEKLAGGCDWFGSGSRIIVTVRDRSTILDEDNQMRPSNYLAHQVNELPLHRAIQLFSKHAFRSNVPPIDCYNFSEEVVLSIGRLPLTLEVVGSLFASTAKSEWDQTLEDLKQVQHRDVRKTLMISFNKLDDREKAIFLDIACFCIGEDKRNAYYMWHDSGYSPRSAIQVLLLMSLIKIDQEDKFWMHNEVRDLGRYIVKGDNVEDAGKRIWVWIDENTLDILGNNEKKPAVRALSLGISHEFTPEELASLPMLRFLGGERMNFVGDFKNCLHRLRWLSWHYCPPDLSAINFHPVNLVVLDLSHNNITDDWVGWLQIKVAKNLKVLDLTHCKKLTKTPDLSEFGKLEKLILAGCEKLSMIDRSIGKLKLLHTLNIKGCVSLQGLPEEIGSLERLSEIIMPSRGEPFKLPETLANLKSLTRFEVRNHNGISQLPDSIGRLTNLTHLLLPGCKSLYRLPDSIGELKSLVHLDLEQSGIREIPVSIGNLKKLKVFRVGHTKIETIPCAVGQLEMLEELDAVCCYHLKDEFLREMGRLTSLRILNLDWTPISIVPTMISGCSSLQTLMITSQKLCPLPELPSSLKCLVVAAAQFPFLPNLSSLVHLDHLEVWRLDSSSASSGENEVISPWKDAQSIHQLPRSLLTLRLGRIPQLPDLSDFKSLSVLIINGCPMPHFPILEYLERLRELKLSSCKFLESTPDVSHLKKLQKLQLSDLPKLAEIPGLGELGSLKFLYISRCNAIEQLPNLSKLKNLQYLRLVHCGKIIAVEGLKELNSLKNVEIKRCMSLESLPDVSAFTKLETKWKWRDAAEHI